MKSIPLRHLAAVASSSVDKKAVEGETPVQLCNYTDVYKNDEVRPHVGLMRATASPEEVARFRLLVGDSVITKDSEDPNDIGVAAFIPETAHDFVCGYHLAIIRPSEEVDPKFLYWQLRSKVALSHFSIGANGMTRYGLGLDTIKSVPVMPLPMGDQRRIADFLDDQVSRIDNIISARRQQIDSLAEFQCQYTRQMTTLGEDVAQAETCIDWMPYISSSWDLPRVSHVFRTGSGSTPPSEDRSFYEGGIPWVNTGDVRDGRLSTTSKSVTPKALDAFTTLSRYEPGALVIAMYGQGATKGRVSILEIPACVNQACCVLSADDPGMTEWAFYWFRAHKEQIVQLAMGAGQPNLSQEIVRSLRIPMLPERTRDDLLPCIEERERATAARTAQMSTQITLLTEYKQSLITAAVTGELDVTTASTRSLA